MGRGRKLTAVGLTALTSIVLGGFVVAAPLVGALDDPFEPVATPATTPVTAPVSAASVNVSIADFAFSPATVTVAAGTTVTWSNHGASIHSVTSDTGAFDSSPSCPTGTCINPGGSYSHTFAQAGSFAYHCKVHTNMTGTVVVNAPPASTTSTAGPATTAPNNNGNPPVSAGGTPVVTDPGDQLAFTGTSGTELWLGFGALVTIALGLALRPRRRSFPDPL